MHDDDLELFERSLHHATDTCSGAALDAELTELGWHDARLPLRPLVKLHASPETGYEFIQVFVLGPLSGPTQLTPKNGVSV